MARITWFDDETEIPVIHEQVEKLESFTQAMADGVIEQKELEQQQDSVVAAMREAAWEILSAPHCRCSGPASGHEFAAVLNPACDATEWTRPPLVIPGAV